MFVEKFPTREQFYQEHLPRLGVYRTVPLQTTLPKGCLQERSRMDKMLHVERQHLKVLLLSTVRESLRGPSAYPCFAILQRYLPLFSHDPVVGTVTQDIQAALEDAKSRRSALPLQDMETWEVVLKWCLNWQTLSLSHRYEADQHIHSK